MTSKKNLYSSIKIGNKVAKNRIFMAPLTRARGSEDGTPNIRLMSEYYAQRASAGLIISEAVAVHQDGLGWYNSCGIFNEKQKAAWRMIVEEVHRNNGLFFMQLWHMGAAVHPSFLGGKPPVSSSSVRMSGSIRTLLGGKSELVKPIQLLTHEVNVVQNYFLKAIGNALEAGVDGVELHAANGFLIDQFIRSSQNKRTDQYGGSVQNRLRFILELVSKASDEFGADKIGIKISPFNSVWGIYDDNPYETFSTLIESLNKYKLAYIHVVKPDSEHDIESNRLFSKIIDICQSPLVLNGGFDSEKASVSIAENKSDAVSFGKYFISNPDLVHRMKHNLTLAEADESTFYTNDHIGYTDYPFIHNN